MAVEFFELSRLFGRDPLERGFECLNDGTLGMEDRYLLVTQGLMQQYNWPHYKIWPEYVSVFSQTKLTGIPVSAIKVPFPAFEILLPKQEPALYVAGRRIKSILCMLATPQHITKMFKVLKPDWLESNVVSNAYKRLYATSDEMFMLSAVCEGADGGQMSLLTQNVSFAAALKCNPDVTVEELATDITADNFQASVNLVAVDDPMAVLPPEAELLMPWRLALSVMFLAIGQHQLASPNVINADIQKYLDAVKRDDKPVIEKLAQRAIQRSGSRSFTIGKYHEIVVGRAAGSGDGEGEGKTAHQKGRHTRSAHWHTYRVGPGRAETVIKFMMPIIVRPDMPWAHSVTHVFRNPNE